MKVVYHCYGGAHASPTAAAIHLGIIGKEFFPAMAEFKKIPCFDETTNHEHGRLIKIGEDCFRNEVFILGRRNSPQTVIRIIKEFSVLCGENPDDYYFVNCVQIFNPLMVTGGFSSRSMGLVGLGRPLVTLGTVLSFPVLAAIVKKTLKYLGKSR